MTDTIAAMELVLSADNEGALYPQKKAIIANLCKRVSRRDYSTEKAIVAFGHFAETAAKWYAKEYATAAEWYSIFPPATRRQAAVQWVSQFETEYEANYWDGINPIPHGLRVPLWANA